MRSLPAWGSLVNADMVSGLPTVMGTFADRPITPIGQLGPTAFTLLNIELVLAFSVPVRLGPATEALAQPVSE